MRGWLLALATLLALIGSASAQTTNTFYSGYVQTGGGPYTQIKATWRIPWVSEHIPEAGEVFENAAQWIGIGCEAGQTLWQLIVEEQIVSSGATTYFAELETFPSGPGGTITDSGHPTLPGDLLTATLQCTSNCTTGNTNMIWQATLVDQTQGWTYSNSFGPFTAGAVDLNAACIITESPLSGGNGGVLANYGATTFTGIKVNSANPSLAFGQSWQNTGNFYGQISGASHPGPNGDSFTTCWQVAAASCPTPTASQPVNYGSGGFH